MTMTKPLIRALGCLAFLAFVFSVGLPAVAEAASQVPPGFIALSEKNMTWDEAKAWCKQKGGKLPLVNNALVVPSDREMESYTIDGFGKFGAPWPSGLEKVEYWLGTEFKDEQAWFAFDIGQVFLGAKHKSGDRRALCVK